LAYIFYIIILNNIKKTLFYFETKIVAGNIRTISFMFIKMILSKYISYHYL